MVVYIMFPAWNIIETIGNNIQPNTTIFNGSTGIIGVIVAYYIHNLIKSHNTLIKNQNVMIENIKKINARCLINHKPK
jgi:hypothetical protein